MAKLDCLFLHTPKLNNWYKPLGDTLYIQRMAIGLLAMADYLERHGFASEVLHIGVECIAPVDVNYVDYIKQTRPEVVGISLHWHYQSYDAIEVARTIKSEIPRQKIVLGGFTASCFAKEILHDYDIVFGVIRGDGEIPMLRFLEESIKAVPHYADVPNLLWRNDGTIQENELSYMAGQEEVDTLNFANYSLLKDRETYIEVFGRAASNYIKKASKKFNSMRRGTPSVVMPIARGCPVNCKWCGGSSNAQRLTSGRKKSIFRSIDRIIDDIRQAVGYGFGTLHFSHYATPGETEYYVRLFRRIREEGIRINAYFECSTLPTREMVDEFALTFVKDGSFISISRMTANEKVRKVNIGSYYTNDDLLEILEYINRNKIWMELSFTLGMPGDDEDGVAPLKALRKMILDKCKYVKSSIVLTNQIEPGSDWFLEPESFGIISDRKSFVDFYNFHKIPNTSYFTHLGYTIPHYFKDEYKNHPERFQKEIQTIRCKEFCTLSNKKYKPNWVGRIQCTLLSSYWKMKALRSFE